MNTSSYFPALVFATIVVLIFAMSKLTIEEVESVCDTQQSGVSAAILTDTVEEQDGLVARAIIVSGVCGE